MMDKPTPLKSMLIRVFLFFIIFIVFRFAYVVTFLSLPVKPINRAEENKIAMKFYLAVFQDLIAEGYLTHDSKSLCVDIKIGEELLTLQKIGVLDSIGIYKKQSQPLVNNTFDFIFFGSGFLDKSAKLGDFVEEIGRALKHEGFLVVHTRSKDTYSFNSLMNLFNCCTFIRSRDINGFDSNVLNIREIIMKRKDRNFVPNGKVVNKCSLSGYKLDLVKKSEPLILNEPFKPWVTLKRNLKNIKYLSSMVDISFKERYVYVDVGARGYGSSIVSWFKKQYPKQNKTFEIYAIEADKTFHEEYRYKKGVTLLPYAAWMKNETLLFEINGGGESRGMGRIQPAQNSRNSVDVDEIYGFDFADWLKNTVSEKDFVVVKMDVEGTEFELIPRLFETGVICLIDEIFLECHYNRWQKCCPGERSSKYQKTYEQCLELFTSLRKSGILVHQWW